MDCETGRNWDGCKIRRLRRSNMKGSKLSSVVILVTLLSIGSAWMHGAEAAAKKRYMIQCGSMGGASYVLGSIISKMLTKEMPEFTFTARTGHGSFSGIPMLEKGEVGFAITAAEGVEEYGSAEIKRRIRTVFPMYINPVHIIAQKSLNAKSIYDLKRKKVSVIFKGGLQNLMNFNVLKALGLKFEDFNSVYLTMVDSGSSFSSRQLDGIMSLGGVPNPTWMECFLTGQGADLIGLSEADRDKVKKMFPYYVKVSIPKGTYKGQEQDVNTMATVLSVFCRDDIPEEVTYKMSKIVHENHAYIVRTYKGAEGATAELLVNNAPYQFHPGAEKYYREIGLIKK
jgi:uncharacterized protein